VSRLKPNPWSIKTVVSSQPEKIAPPSEPKTPG
jgi:hypothetical protein